MLINQIKFNSLCFNLLRWCTYCGFCSIYSPTIVEIIDSHVSSTFLFMVYWCSLMGLSLVRVYSFLFFFWLNHVTRLDNTKLDQIFNCGD